MNRQRDACQVKGCQSPPVGDGYCFHHYSKLVAKGFGICSDPGCGKKAHRGRFCDTHAKAEEAAAAAAAAETA